MRACSINGVRRYFNTGDAKKYTDSHSVLILNILVFAILCAALLYSVLKYRLTPY